MRAKSTDRDKLTAKQRVCYSDFITDFVAVILSQSEGLGKIALGIVKIYSGSPFLANWRCSWSVCRSQLSWTRNIPQKSQNAGLVTDTLSLLSVLVFPVK